MGRKQGITEQQLLDLPHFESSTAYSEIEKLVLHYTVAMTQTPVEVSDELFAALRQHFDPRRMAELTSAIAWENYRARFNHAFGIEAEGFSTGSVCALPARRPQAVGAAADQGHM